jgi:YegS/Rv2252/BmrU family lipid kinase
MKNITFLINPVSIEKKQINIEVLIREIFDADHYNVSIQYSNSGEHLSLLAKDAVVKGEETIATIGGDGTVQRVGRELIGSKSILAIVPVGSGNGIARHFNISMDPKSALNQIRSGAIKAIDTMDMNGEVSLNVAGVGFEGRIAKKFADSNVRGLLTYLWMVAKEYFSYKPQRYDVRIDDKNLSLEAFLISICNGSQWGNNARIGPQAIIDDGFIDVVIIKKFPFNAGIDFTWRLFSGSVQKFSYAEIYKCKSVRIISERLQGHIDGEPLDFGNTLEGHIVPNSLNVIVPFTQP